MYDPFIAQIQHVNPRRACRSRASCGTPNIRPSYSAAAAAQTTGRKARGPTLVAACLSRFACLTFFAPPRARNTSPTKNIIYGTYFRATISPHLLVLLYVLTPCKHFLYYRTPHPRNPKMKKIQPTVRSHAAHLLPLTAILPLYMSTPHSLGNTTCRKKKITLSV